MKPKARELNLVLCVFFVCFFKFFQKFDSEIILRDFFVVVGFCCLIIFFLFSPSNVSLRLRAKKKITTPPNYIIYYYYFFNCIFPCMSSSVSLLPRSDDGDHHSTAYD